MKCLNCPNEFEPKRKDVAKYCSVKCRVQYGRKNPGNSVTKVQMQVLYNSMMEAIGKIVVIPTKEVYDSPPLKITYDEPPKYQPARTTLKSFDWYRLAKKDIEDEDDWQKMKTEIEEAPNLTQKQKNLLLTTNI